MKCNKESLTQNFLLWVLKELLGQQERLCSSVTQSCPTLCDPMDCSLPGSSVHGIFQPRLLEWAATSDSRGSSQPREGLKPHLLRLLHWQAGGLFTTAPPGKPQKEGYS